MTPFVISLVVMATFSWPVMQTTPRCRKCNEEVYEGDTRCYDCEFDGYIADDVPLGAHSLCDYCGRKKQGKNNACKTTKCRTMLAECAPRLACKYDGLCKWCERSRDDDDETTRQNLCGECHRLYLVKYHDAQPWVCDYCGKHCEAGARWCGNILCFDQFPRVPTEKQAKEQAEIEERFKRDEAKRTRARAEREKVVEETRSLKRAKMQSSK